MDVDVKGELYLGTDGEELVHYEAANLTTHGVIVGMTGSGKTGLGVITIEEALLQGTPALVIDPKGDMANLDLCFPTFAPSDFAPWISEADAGRNNMTVDEKAAATATMWKEGLERSGIGTDRMQRLADIDVTIYTPGSTSGVPLNMIGSLAAPKDADAESLQDEVDGITASLLGLVDIESDPLSSREHILIANIIHHAWSQGQDLDMATLLAQIQQPPMRKLGVIDLETFFPAPDRMKLALALNGLLASPSFASWAEGQNVDIQTLLYDPNGAPRCAVISIAHLSDTERQFVVTLLLSKVVTWMRKQSGTSDLRALVYMDEVFGYVPPTKNPPSKQPILTLLKQARAFGVGLVLSTQNPVDLDYKALSNAGTWMVGRLQTERDQQRLLDGMRNSAGTVDIDSLSATISGLEKRHFVLHSTHASGPRVFGTRWAMNYLAGPMSKTQIADLMADKTAAVASNTAAVDATVAAAAVAVGQQAPAALADDESPVLPPVADGTSVRYVDPAAPWSENIGATAGGHRLIAGAAVRVRLLFDDTKSDLRHDAEWEAIITPLDDNLDDHEIIVVDYDDRDLVETAPNGAVYVLPEAKIANKTYFSGIESRIRDWLYRSEQVELFYNPGLKLYSTPGETREAFAQRCADTADAEADAEVDKIRERLTKEEERLKDQIAKHQDKIREIEADRESRARQQRTDQVMDVAGAVLGSLLGGRRSTRSILSGVRRSQSQGRMIDKTEQRLSTAENRLTESIEDLEELEDKLLEEMAEIQEAWEEKAETIETYEVGLEKNDIDVSPVTLVWIPSS